MARSSFSIWRRSSASASAKPTQMRYREMGKMNKLVAVFARTTDLAFGGNAFAQDKPAAAPPADAKPAAATPADAAKPAAADAAKPAAAGAPPADPKPPEAAKPKVDKGDTAWM